MTWAIFKHLTLSPGHQTLLCVFSLDFPVEYTTLHYTDTPIDTQTLAHRFKQKHVFSSQCAELKISLLLLGYTLGNNQVPNCGATLQAQGGSLGIQVDGGKCVEPWEGLTYLFSQVGRCKLVSHSRKPQVPCVLNVHKAGRMPKHCVTQCDSVHAGPLKAMGIHFIRPVSRLCEHC